MTSEKLSFINKISYALWCAEPARRQTGIGKLILPHASLLKLHGALDPDIKAPASPIACISQGNGQNIEALASRQYHAAIANHKMKKNKQNGVCVRLKKAIKGVPALTSPTEFQEKCPGRPPKYRNAPPMNAKINEYFEQFNEQEKTGKYPSLVGLALFLGFSVWESVEAYSTKNTRFAEIIKRARGRIERELIDTGMKHPQRSTFCMFRLKHLDHAYREVQGVDYGGKISITVLSAIPEPDPPSIQAERPKQLSSGDD